MNKSFMQELDTTKALPKPWFWTEQDFEDQLKREVGSNHILYEMAATTIARRQDSDDVAFGLENGKYAVVHLTWSNHFHKDPRWPVTEIFDNWESLYRNRILVDEKEFEGGL
jgi:hypothetical protein